MGHKARILEGVAVFIPRGSGVLASIPHVAAPRAQPPRCSLNRMLAIQEAPALALSELTWLIREAHQGFASHEGSACFTEREWAARSRTAHS